MSLTADQELKLRSMIEWTKSFLYSKKVDYENIDKFIKKYENELKSYIKTYNPGG